MGTRLDLKQIDFLLEQCAGRVAADNLWAPSPPTFVDRRANNLSARQCHCCCVLILLQFSMTKKGHQKILRIERIFSGIFEEHFWPPTPRRSRRRREKLTGAPPPTQCENARWRTALLPTYKFCYPEIEQSSF